MSIGYRSRILRGRFKRVRVSPNGHERGELNLIPSDLAHYIRDNAGGSHDS
jgi:hypothetical protein